MHALNVAGAADQASYQLNDLGGEKIGGLYYNDADIFIGSEVLVHALEQLEFGVFGVKYVAGNIVDFENTEPKDRYQTQQSNG
jgi:hypothetical protein